jgi:hypothetical protein
MVYSEKSQPAPVSLAAEKVKANGKYNEKDVLNQLVSDFKNKCYICEYQQPSINVEHFVPHKGNVDLKFDWNNLFLACGHCNNTKLDKYDNILNCTNKSDDVENKLRYSIKPFPKEKVQIEVLDNSQKTLNTKDLLLDIYNGTTFPKQIEAETLTNNLLDEIFDFQKNLFDYFKTHSQEDKNYFLIKIKTHLNRTSNFTAFKRWIIKDNPRLKTEFEPYFD